MITRLASVRSLLWSVAILLLVVGSDQLGWQAGHKAGKAEQVSPVAAELGDKFVQVLQRVAEIRSERNGTVTTTAP